MSSSSIKLRIAFAVFVTSIIIIAAIGFIYFNQPTVVSPGRNLVGVIHVEGAIVETEEAGSIISAVNQAIFNSSVKAVVLRIDSPGGYADLVEAIYLDILELKKTKPVVASVVSALSGGYYIAVAADYIFALPTSFVGNVGVIGVGPPTLIPSEFELETGALKATGFKRLLFPLNLSHALDNFASAVEDGRGNRTRVGSNEIRRGTIYIGSEALKVGLVDEMGSLQKAAEKAAQLSNLSFYEIAEVKPGDGATTQVTAGSNQTRIQWAQLNVETLNKINPPPAIYYMYLPSQAYSQSQDLIQSPESPQAISQAPADPNKPTVIVDMSHGNLVSEWEFDILAAELVKRNMVLTFASTWQEVASGLSGASGLIVAAPTKPYMLNESIRIEEFVNEGRVLLIFFDPAIEYVSVPELLGPVNSLANYFGLSFAKGYLYNEEEHYGLYRNIYVRRFENTSLTRNLDTIVLLTSTHINTLLNQAAYTSPDTYSSTGERTGIYSPIAVIEGSGTIASFGDITFMTEPFCYLEDNYQLVLNIASKLAEIRVR